jgi:ribosomal protein S18 acetylase RimI-like enzyme
VETVYLNARGEFLVGSEAGKIVAMGALKYLADDVAEVKRMRVHPAYQRRGYGSAILKELEKRAVSLGYRMLRLDTTVRQTGAQRFYEKHGYHAVGVGTLAGFSVIYYQKVLSNTGVTPTHMC